eukprot:1818621-Alexandrium_andersonii.AAC.1
MLGGHVPSCGCASTSKHQSVKQKASERHLKAHALSCVQSIRQLMSIPAVKLDKHTWLHQHA